MTTSDQPPLGRLLRRLLKLAMVAAAVGIAREIAFRAVAYHDRTRTPASPA